MLFRPTTLCCLSVIRSDAHPRSLLCCLFVVSLLVTSNSIGYNVEQLRREDLRLAIFRWIGQNLGKLIVRKIGRVVRSVICSFENETRLPIYFVRFEFFTVDDRVTAGKIIERTVHFR